MPISSETLKRYALCILGLFFSAQGVAITKLGALGVSPISSVANVMSLRLPALSLGNWLIIWNCVLILGQILILRRKFQPIQLLQIPLSFLFGILQISVCGHSLGLVRSCIRCVWSTSAAARSCWVLAFPSVSLPTPS